MTEICPLLLRVLGRLPLKDDVTQASGRRRRSLKGGNRGKVSRGGAGRYGDSGVGSCGSMRSIG
jgi:hypothetical protein